MLGSAENFSESALDWKEKEICCFVFSGHSFVSHWWGCVLFNIKEERLRGFQVQGHYLKTAGIKGSLLFALRETKLCDL